MSDILTEIKRALEIEAEGIAGLIPRQGEAIVQAVEMLMACRGKVIVTGMGKSGHIANKIAATLSSTGTPAFFLHPAEAIHGDLGILAQGDIVLALSNSGNTEEVLRLLGPIRRIGVPLIAMTGDPESELAQRAEVHLDVSVPREACPLNLAPTASTTAALAMGDAIVAALLNLRNFREEDYALFHPGGNLGKKLMTTVGDLMDTGVALPIVPESKPVGEVMREIQNKHYGLTTIVDSEGKLIGGFSMGDFTRLHIADTTLAFMERPIAEYMIRNPQAVTPDMLAARALNLMENNNIRALFVVDLENRPVGIIGIYEVLKAIDY